MREIIVVGAGASGMTAAIFAARRGASVTLLESNDIPGKKILSTGNGRCNLTNRSMSEEYFRGDNPAFVGHILRTVKPGAVDEFFDQMGILTKARDTYVYPRSDQAASVRQALELSVKQLGIELLTGVHIDEIRKTKRGFMIIDRTSGCSYTSSRVILSCGSKASNISGSDGSGYALARQLGHTISPVVPALVQLRSSDPCFSKLAGIRTEAGVSIFVDGAKVAEDRGELQLTNYGISGIPVFQVSRFAAKALYEERTVRALIDFIPEFEESKLLELILKKRSAMGRTTAQDLLGTIFPAKLIPVLLAKSQIGRTVWAEKISPETWQGFCHQCKRFEVDISAANAFEQAQICAGGVRTDEINPDTMESLLHKGLFLTGELLDVDGICGGYNLHFAWISGMLAGQAAAR